MKKLIAITTLLLSVNTFAQCSFGLDIKKEGAKTAYAAGGVSVSKKIQDALKAQGCNISYNVMTKSQVKAMQLERAKKRYEKLLKETKAALKDVKKALRGKI